MSPVLQNLFSHALFTLGNFGTYVLVTQGNIISKQIFILFLWSFCTLNKWYQGENINGSSNLKYILESYHHMNLNIKWAHLWVQPKIFNQ